MSPVIVRSFPSSLRDEWAAALFQRAEGVISGYGRKPLVDVPFSFRFRRRFDLDEIHVMDHAAVFADMSILREKIVHRRFAHLCQNRRGIVGSDSRNRL